MKWKHIVILFVCLIIIAFTYLVFLISGSMLPSLEPFSIAVAMICIMLESKRLYKLGNINKVKLNLVFYIGLFTVHIFIINGIVQIYRLLYVI